MNAFRFLSLLTVGFSLLVLVFLLNATQGRMETEAVRVLEGPEVVLEAGQAVEWALLLGGGRIEEAWPAPQRQPRLFLVGEPGGALGDAEVVAEAHYFEDEDLSRPAFISGGDPVVGVPGEKPGELAFGPLWMNWDHDLKLRVSVKGGGSGTAKLVLRGEATVDYLAARSVARTLWFVFTAIAAAGFAGLMLTLRDGTGASAQGARPPASS